MSQVESASQSNFEKPQHHQTDLFTVLGVKPDATLEEIKTKYGELVLLYHPDKGGDTQQFRDLKIAYKILSNPKNREIYTKSLSSTFGDITQEYRDPKTGQYLDIGYEINLEEDFTRGTKEERDRKHQEFMQKFHDSRTEEDKKLIEEATKDQSLDKYISQRDLEIPMIEGLCAEPGKLNTNLFNQIFEATMRQQSRDLQPMGLPNAVGQMGLAPMDNTSIFANDNLMDYQNHRDFQTYETPSQIDASKYDPNLNVTKIRDNNPQNLVEEMERRLQEHQASRDNLLNLHEKDYEIAPEHDNRNKELSHLNMLGQELAHLAIDPPRPKFKPDV